jgi:hypothetical protein
MEVAMFVNIVWYLRSNWEKEIYADLCRVETRRGISAAYIFRMEDEGGDSSKIPAFRKNLLPPFSHYIHKNIFRKSCLKLSFTENN